MIRLCDTLGENCSDVPSPGLWQHLCILIPKGPQTDDQWTRVARGNYSGAWKWGIGFSSLDIKLLSCFISLGSWKTYKKKNTLGVPTSQMQTKATIPLFGRRWDIRWVQPFITLSTTGLHPPKCASTPHLSTDPCSLGPRVLNAFLTISENRRYQKDNSEEGGGAGNE